MVALLCGPRRSDAAEVSFRHDVAPIILKRCTGCHGERSFQSNWRAHTFRDLMKPGTSGQAPVVVGKPEQSRLFQLITAASEARRMPKADQPLSAEQIDLVRRWIVQGAKFDGGDVNLPFRALLGPRQHPPAPAVYRVPVPVMALAFAPGGRELYAGGYHEVTVWDATSGALRRRLGGLPQRTKSLSFSPDGKHLLVAGGTPGEYGEVTLIQLEDDARAPAKPHRTIVDTFPDIVHAASFDRAGRRIVAGCADASVRTYQLEGTGSPLRTNPLWTARVHSDWVTGVSFSPDGRFVASSSKDMTVKIYEAGSGALFTTYKGHNKNYGKFRGQSPVFAVRFDEARPLAASAGGGGAIHLWDPVEAQKEDGTAADMEERFSKESHARYVEHGFAREVYAVVLRAGFVFAASADGGVKQFDLATQKELRAFSGMSDWVFAVDYEAASGRVAAGAHNGEVRVWEATTGALLCAFKARPTADRAQLRTP